MAPPANAATITNASHPRIARLRWRALHVPARAAMFHLLILLPLRLMVVADVEQGLTGGLRRPGGRLACGGGENCNPLRPASRIASPGGGRDPSGVQPELVTALSRPLTGACWRETG